MFQSYSKTSGYFLRDYVAKAMVIMISSRVKISCYLQVLAGKLTWYFTGVYIIKLHYCNLLYILGLHVISFG